MAKVKAAKQKITEFLKAKGLDAAEIKEAFDELEAADQSLDSLASQLDDASTKNKQWDEWYKTAAPEINAIGAEREQLKARIEQLQKAGIRLEDIAQPTSGGGAVTAGGQYVTPEQFKTMQENFSKAASDVIKGSNRISIRHYNRYKEEVDFDALEDIVSKRGMSIEDAYNVWVSPKEKERESKERQEAIDRGIREGVQAEMSKQGVATRRSRKVDAEVENAPLDKPAPTYNELKEAFVSDWNTATTH